MPSGKPFILGLTGGIASGKSHVAKAMLEAARGLGLVARVIHSDVLAREAWEDGECRAKLTALLGELAAPPLPGRVDRGVVAKAMFGNPELRREVEGVIHPFVARRRAELMAGGGAQVYVLDSPLLLESGLGARCDAVVFVDTPAEVRQKRALARGWTTEGLAEREAAQWPVAGKRAAASFVVDGTLEEPELAEFCGDLLRRWVLIGTNTAGGI